MDSIVSWYSGYGNISFKDRDNVQGGTFFCVKKGLLLHPI